MGVNWLKVDILFNIENSIKQLYYFEGWTWEGS